MVANMGLSRNAWPAKFLVWQPLQPTTASARCLPRASASESEGIVSGLTATLTRLANILRPFR